MALRVKQLSTYWLGSRSTAELLVATSVVHLVVPATDSPLCRLPASFKHQQERARRSGSYLVVWEAPPEPGNLTCRDCQRRLKDGKDAPHD